MNGSSNDGLGASRFSCAGRLSLAIVAFALAGHSGLAGAEKPYLVRDINETPVGSNPNYFFPVGERLFFRADDGMYGRELWVTDGTPEGTVLVKDINQGTGGSDLNSFTALGDRLFFTADDGAHGEELWVTDGTPEGTLLLKDINPGSGGAGPSGFTVLGDRLYFGANDGTHGSELWATDGTSEGTVPWREYLGQPENWKVYDPPTAFGDRLFFIAYDGTHGGEFWVTDGTPEGTVLFKDINPGSGDSWPYIAIVLGDRLFFQADDGTHGEELWVTDATPEGTVLVKDINPGSGSSEPGYFTFLGDRLFFMADDGTHGRELWVTDGTPEGTVLFKDINPGTEGSGPGYFTFLGDRLFFVADDGTHGRELWVTDGTPEGTALLKDINPGSGDSSPDIATVLGDRLFFRAYAGTDGVVLCVTDGTSEGTVLLAGHYPDYLTVLGDRLFFRTDNFELWITDGTAEGTLILSPGSVSLGDVFCGMGCEAGNSPEITAHPNGTLFFVADDGIHGRELWVTDGTSEGTAMVEDLFPGSPGGLDIVCENWESCDAFSPEIIAHPNGTLFFAADDDVHGYELWALRVTPCPDDGDTHCLGLEVLGPEGGGPGTYVATATAQDDSGDSISYTFSAQRGDEEPIVIGPQAENVASLALDEGTWTVSVQVDDDRWCSDVAAGAVCPVLVEVHPPGGLQRPGDSNQDGELDLSDAVWLLGHLFLGMLGQEKLPCEGGTASSPGSGDLALADVNGDGRIDLSDPVSILSFLFLGGKPPAPGTECVRIAGCPDQAGCQ